MVKGRALALLVLMALAVAAPLGVFGPACDDCPPGAGESCLDACGCCPCCQVQVVARVVRPDVRPGVVSEASFLQPREAPSSAAPGGVFHVPKPA